MSRLDYFVKVMSHLENKSFYQRLDEDPTKRFAEEVTFVSLNMTDRFSISSEMFHYLRPQKPQTSQFYILPKIHKNGVPLRPIVSSCRTPTGKISHFVDYIFKPLVAKHHPILKIPQTSY